MKNLLIASLIALSNLKNAWSRKSVQRKFYTMRLVAPQLIDTGPFPQILGRNYNQCIAETHIVLNNIIILDDGPFLTEMEWSTFCKGFPDADDVICNFERLQDEQLTKSCNQAGGKIVSISFDTCNIPMVIGDFDDDKIVNIKKIQFVDFPQCAGLNCNESDIVKQISEDNEKYDMKCPIEKKFNRFALKYRKKNGQLVVRSCLWLRGKPIAMKMKICKSKNYQLYADDYMPASITCPETCNLKGCIEESQDANFFAGYEIDPDTGDDVLIVRDCKWLKNQTGGNIITFCHYPPKRLSDGIKYGDASEICRDTCKSTCD